MYKLISALIAANLVAANANYLGSPKSKNNSSYFSINTSHAFKTSVKASDIENKNGYKSDLPNIDLALGRYITNNYRLELSAGYRKFKIKHNWEEDGEPWQQRHKATIYRLMINNYYDFTVNDIFTPYAMLGLGLAHFKSGAVRDIDYSENETHEVLYKSSNNFSYQFGLGADIKLNEKISLDLGIRHINYGGIKSPHENEKIKLKSNEILAGIKFSF